MDNLYLKDQSFQDERKSKKCSIKILNSYLKDLTRLGVLLDTTNKYLQNTNYSDLSILSQSLLKREKNDSTSFYASRGEIDSEMNINFSLSNQIKTALRCLCNKYESTIMYKKTSQRKLQNLLDQEAVISNFTRENSEYFEELPGYLR